VKVLCVEDMVFWSCISWSLRAAMVLEVGHGHERKIVNSAGSRGFPRLKSDLES
jgi:hypothetical protein